MFWAWQVTLSNFQSSALGRVYQTPLTEKDFPFLPLIRGDPSLSPFLGCSHSHSLFFGNLGLEGSVLHSGGACNDFYNGFNAVQHRRSNEEINSLTCGVSLFISSMIEKVEFVFKMAR